MSKKILILDDEPGHLLVSKRALLRSYASVSIIEASNSEEAECHVDSSKPDLCIFDLNLGPTTSISLITKLRSKNSRDHLPILVVSTSALQSDIDSAYEAGANCFLIKSEDPSEFASQLVKSVKFFLPIS